MRRSDIRLDLGHLTMPDRPGYPLSGQPIVVCGYLLRHPRGLFLWDTGLARADAETSEFAAAGLAWRLVQRGWPSRGGHGALVDGAARGVRPCRGPVRA